MGAAVCAAVSADPELTLVAAVSRSSTGDCCGVPISHELRAFADASCDVVVDFTVAEAARVTLPWLAMHGVHAVVGTTGFDADDLEMMRSTFGNGPAHCVVAPNFAISAVVMMRFAEMAAPWFDTVEIVEYHHDKKIDAPSGTAIATARRIEAGRGEPLDHSAAVPIHSVRMRGMVAHQEVIFGTDGQTLTIRQDSYDRQSFMPGVVLACKRIGDHRGLTIGLDALLDI
jgi:4-hydroxy-tetrahydrodipicolinate reductase